MDIALYGPPGTGQMTVRSAGRFLRLNIPQISYIESAGRKVIVHTDRTEIAYYDRMSELESALSADFFRIHRGYLVNLSRVAGVEPGGVILDSGERLLLSKYKKNAFLAAYQSYRQNRG